MDSERGSDYSKKEISLNDESTIAEPIIKPPSIKSGKVDCCCGALQHNNTNHHKFGKI